MPNQYVAKIIADPKEIISRILNDESTKDIATSLGVSRRGLNDWLLKHCEDDWKSAQIAKALTRKEQAEDDLERVSGETMSGKQGEGDAEVMLTREDAPMQSVKLRAAEIRLKAAQWDLERILKRIYGQEQNNNQSPVVINIGIKRGQTIDVSTDKAVNE